MTRKISIVVSFEVQDDDYTDNFEQDVEEKNFKAFEELLVDMGIELNDMGLALSVVDVSVK